MKTANNVVEFPAPPPPEHGDGDDGTIHVRITLECSDPEPEPPLEDRTSVTPAFLGFLGGWLLGGLT